MCLDIDRNLHDELARSRIAKQDILVYKVLKVGFERTRRGNLVKRYYAPYMGLQWVMGRLEKARMRVYGGAYRQRVEEGLHSCLNMVSAYSRGGGWSNHEIFPAVIPKGSAVYFGRGDEVASSQLVVYADMVALEKARGKVGPGIPRADIAKVRS